jgi:23S rRNA G2445 N2-methylase RlmL
VKDPVSEHGTVKRNPVQFIATCGGGLESVLREEMAARGWSVEERESGAVRFAASGSAIAEANLVLRTASRVLLPQTSGPVRNYDDLYGLVTHHDWASLIPATSSIDVAAFSSERALRDSRFAALRVKDGIVDSQQRRLGRRSDVRRRRADFPNSEGSDVAPT